MAYLAALRALEEGLPSPDAALAKDPRDVLSLEEALDPRVLVAAGSDGPGELADLAFAGAAPGPALIERMGQQVVAAAVAGRRLADKHLREPAGLGDVEAVL